nr:RusA family crossover junction endodeoxyribonuclease [Alistipes onderdonkii]
MMALEFFLGGSPPTITHQHQQVTVRKGKPVFYEPDRLKAARQQLTWQLKIHRPAVPLTGPVRLLTKWCFPLNTKHKIDGEYKTTRPDTDNLQKLLKDVMTDVGFWEDDAQVASEIIEKFYARIPGIYIRVEQL